MDRVEEITQNIAQKNNRKHKRQVKRHREKNEQV